LFTVKVVFSFISQFASSDHRVMTRTEGDIILEEVVSIEDRDYLISG